MITVSINEDDVKELTREEIKRVIYSMENELLFWDTNELKKRTCMSFETIQKTFFFEPKFPKYKIGGKWYFPVKETQEFLLQWIKQY
jgi:phage pi2 protein 07